MAAFPTYNLRDRSAAEHANPRMVAALAAAGVGAAHLPLIHHASIAAHALFRLMVTSDIERRAVVDGVGADKLLQLLHESKSADQRTVLASILHELTVVRLLPGSKIRASWSLRYPLAPLKYPAHSAFAVPLRKRHKVAPELQVGFTSPQGMSCTPRAFRPTPSTPDRLSARRGARAAAPQHSHKRLTTHKP